MAQINWSYDELVLAVDLVARRNWQGVRASDSEVVELSRLLRSSSLHPVDGRPENFRSAASVQRKTYDIATGHPESAAKATKGGQLEKRVLEEFLEDPVGMSSRALLIRSALASESGGDASNPLADDEELQTLTALEGRVLAVQYLKRERSASLRDAKLRRVERDGGSRNCEVCNFSFAATYGEVGVGYIEVHHVLPLHASGPRVTRLDDLALLCSNCHRMIHRARPWLTPDQLRKRVRYEAERENA